MSNNFKLLKKKNYLVLKAGYQYKDFIEKELKGNWHGLYKGWTFVFSREKYDQIVKIFEKNAVTISVHEDLKEEINRIRAVKKDIPSMYKYQRKALEHLIKKGREKFFLCGEVGTGKSKITIELIKHRIEHNNVKKCLVICPKSIMVNFGNEIEVHSNISYTIIEGSPQKKKQIIEESEANIDIVNYEMLSKLDDRLISRNYDMIVFDEIHNCKNRKSATAKSAYQIAKNTKYKLGLSGTLLNNNVEDLFMTFKIIDEEVFGRAFTHFKARYLITIQNSYVYYKIIGVNNKDELKTKIAGSALEIKLRDVVKDLPPEVDIIKYFQLKGESKRMYDEIKDHMMTEYEGEIIESNYILDRVLKFSQLASGFIKKTDTEEVVDIGDEKIDLLKEVLQSIDKKVLIVCRFTKSIDKVSELCKKMGLSHYIYDGRTKDKEIYLKFQKDDTRVFIAQIQKTEGYSLSSAKYTIFYELDYSRKNHVQARGRILRASGSEHDQIFYIYLMAKGTIEEVVKKTLESKDFKSRDAFEYVRSIK